MFDLKIEKLDRKLPSVSVIIPAFNSEKVISQTIESLRNMNYPQDKLEIIVVDDASRDRTSEVALQHGVKLFRREKTGGCAAAKNTGVAQAKNEIIAFIDADVTVDENWLRELVRPFMNSNVGATGGLIKSKFRKNNALEKYVAYDNYYRKRFKNAKSVSGSNSAYRREVFNVVGELDPYIGEDPDFPYRVSAHSYKIVFNEKAEVYHPFPNKVSLYLKKQAYYAWQRALIFLLRPECRTSLFKDEITPLPMLLQPLVSAATIASLFLILLFDPFKFVFLFLLILQLLLNIPFLRYIYSKETKLMLFAFFMSVLRSFVYVIGSLGGVLSFIKVKTLGYPTQNLRMAQENCKRNRA